MLVISALGYMKLLIFSPNTAQFFQQFCDIKKQIEYAATRHSKIFSLTSDGLLYIHEVRSFSSLAVVCSLWEDVSSLHLSSEDILIGYASGLILSVPIIFYKPEANSPKKGGAAVFRPKITLMDEDYKVFSFYPIRVTAIKGEYRQFVSMYENHKVVLWDKNLKLPMY